MKKVYLTLAAIIRNQEHYVKEWLTFQKLSGFERFLIALHQCSDKTEEVIRRLPFSDDIIIRKYDTGQFIQMSVYAEWMRDFRDTTFWNILRCNHYNTRSMEDWVSRRKRGSCNDFRLAENYNVEHFYRYNNEPVADLTIQRFVPELTRQLLR